VVRSQCAAAVPGAPPPATAAAATVPQRALVLAKKELNPVTLCTTRGHCCTASPTAALCAALRSVVMVRVGSSWGSGVLLSPAGLVLTNAHLFGAPGRAAGGQGGAASDGSASVGRASASVRVQLLQPSSCHSDPLQAPVATAWLPAAVLHVCRGHLDAAMLLLQPPGASSSMPLLPDLKPIALAPGCPVPGQPAFVAGHGLFGPAAGWPPAITSGCVASVVRLPHISGSVDSGGSGRGCEVPGRASMLVGTASVHAGASGGALLDAAGRLLGLVTSNARHARGGTLPNLNFSIAADELRPWMAWAAAWDRAASVCGPDGDAARHAALAALAALDIHDSGAAALWALLPPLQSSRDESRAQLRSRL
jgi:peroxisomal leader peptide-processing protease